VLHSFGNGSDGKYPYANLVNVNGTLYGTTSLGGSYRQGIVYSVTPTGMEKVWHSFGYGSDGAQPDAGLINVNGVLYGTTDTGTHYNAGTVFSITPSGKEKVLHTFGIGYDGRYPVASLINVSGTLYGTTAGGGQYAGSPGAGTVFSITTSGKEKVLHSFGLGYDGAQPRAGLINVNGTLYGTTEGGGKYGSVTTFYGTVFSITPSGKEKVLHSFGNGSDGRDPQASLLNVKGTLYGTTDGGGQYKAGTVFSITPSGGEKVLHSFGNGSDGKYPYASLINVDGTLYGTTASGGQYAGSPGAGTIFSIRPSGKEKVLHSFGKVTAGVDPQASLTDVSGTLYGTTNLGGGYNTIYSSYGTVFSFTP
jgi:uncharacterized repeat protein (TIGR03803 family)